MCGTAGEIREVLKTFEYFLEMHDANFELSADDVKNSFKAANFVETAVASMRESETLDDFMVCLSSWFQSKGRTLSRDCQFFCTACDQLLMKCFNLDTNLADIAIRMYCSVCKEDRFENVVRSLILNSASLEAVLNYTIANKSKLDIPALKCRLVLLNWKEDLDAGKLDDVKTKISELLDGNLTLLLQMLLLSDLSDDELNLTKLVLTELVFKLENERFPLEKFWFDFVKTVDGPTIVRVCKEHREVLALLVRFLLKCADRNVQKMFDVERPSGELDNGDVIAVLKLLVADKSLAMYLKFKIDDHVHESRSPFWTDVLRAHF